MTEEKKELVIKKYKGQLPSYKMDSFERSLNDASDDIYEKLMAIPPRKKIVTILLGVFLGWAGINRFYISNLPFAIIKILLTVVAVFCAISGNLSDLIIAGVIIAFYIIDIFWASKKGMDVNYDEVMSFMREEREKEQN